jgi:hypothetical protein
MPPRRSNLVPSGVHDSAEDYKDLLEEMNVEPTAQADVFDIIKKFRDNDTNSRSLENGTGIAHRFLKKGLCGARNVAKLGQMDRVSRPFKDLSYKKKTAALASRVSG